MLADPSLVDQLPPERQINVRRILARLPQTFEMVRRMAEIGVTVIAATDAGIPNRFFDDYPADIADLCSTKFVMCGGRVVSLPAS